jgi:hypothetical protein
MVEVDPRGEVEVVVAEALRASPALEQTGDNGPDRGCTHTRDHPAGKPDLGIRVSDKALDLGIDHCLALVAQAGERDQPYIGPLLVEPAHRLGHHKAAGEFGLMSLGRTAGV